MLFSSARTSTFPIGRGFLVSAVAVSLALAGCGSSDDSSAADTAAQECIADFDPTVDYFPDKSEIVDAENFHIGYEKSYQVLTVEEPFPEGDPESYVLVRCGAPAPELNGALADAPEITVPITSLYSASTTHLPLVTALGALDTLTGVSDGSFASDAEVLERIESGDVTEYAPGSVIDVEKVVLAAPDVLMTGGTEEASYTKLREAGISVVANAEWLESSPLGRAEWVKVMAALTGTETAAADVFDDISDRYNEVAELATDQPAVSVLPGSMHEGTWSMPSGGSYVGQLLADAGATYPWEDTTGTGSQLLDIESVFAKAGDASVWTVVNSWTSVEQALGEDERYAELDAVDGGQVWNANKALGPQGGNDYWERGVLRPDLVLADLVALLHPDVLPDHDFEFYQKLPAA